jgi:hypothetical protein
MSNISKKYQSDNATRNSSPNSSKITSLLCSLALLYQSIAVPKKLDKAGHF